MTDQITALKRGNTKLIEVLMDMCAQYLGDIDDSSICTHLFMSAGENVFDVLCEAGMAEGIDGATFKLKWDVLEKRKENE